MTSWWAIALAAIAVLCLIIIPAWGAYKFNPQRARNVKHAEREREIVEHVVAARLSHPEIVKVARLDRHPFFLLLHVGVLGYACCVLAGAPLTSNVAVLGPQTRLTMASCFLIGSTLVLTGATLGLQIGRWTIMPSVRQHVTASVLGDDISLPYRLSMAGMGAIAVSTTIYCRTSFNSTAASLGGWLAGTAAAACFVTIVLFHFLVRKFEKWEATLIADAKAQLGLGD